MSKRKEASLRTDRNEVAELYREVDVARQTRGKKGFLSRSPRAKAKKRSAKPQNATLPLFKRPIVCPPDGAGKSVGIRTLGYAARLSVIAFAVFGFAFFIADAFALHYDSVRINHRGQVYAEDTAVTGTIFLASLLFTAVIALLCIFRKARIPALCGAGGGLLATVVAGILVPKFGRGLLSIPLTLMNAILERLHGVNYFTSVRLFSLPDSGLSEKFLARAAGVLLALIVALVFVPCMTRRIRILPPAVTAAVVLVFIFVCNIAGSNWAFVILLASFAAVLVMWAFDGLYANKPNADRYDTTAELFPETDRPSLPEEVASDLRERARVREEKKKERMRREEKKRLRRSKKEAPVRTVDEEISDYFAAPKPKREKRKKVKKAPKVRLTSAEQKALKAERRREALALRAHRAEIRRQVDAVERYDRITADSRAAAGGFAGIAVFLLMMLLLLFPALTVSGKFQTIPAIDEQMEYYREYLTALLVGDEDVLDAIDYENDPVNTMPHSAELTDRYYSGEELLYIRSADNQNLYLTGWVGTDFRDGSWYGASEEQLTRYRALFDYQDFPAESIKTDFYRYMLADEVSDPLDESTDLVSVFSYAPSYGTILEQVSIQRLSQTLGSRVYLPSSYVSDVGLMQFESTEESDLRFINYYDGVVTGRDFRDVTSKYSSLAYVTTMKNDTFMERIAGKIVEYNVNMELCERYREGYFTDLRVNPSIQVKTTEGGARVLTASLDGIACSVESYYDEYGTLMDTKIISQSDLAASSVSGISFELFEAYVSTMTKAEKKELEESADVYAEYREYVYDTYLGTDIHTLENDETAGSSIISELSDALAEDFYLLIEENAAGGEYSAFSYTQRHAFVLSVIEYMRETCTYLERDEETLDILIDRDSLVIDESLDAVENFLTVTKQGYCVQFASALCLLLREQGIPARYVEGYVVDGQTRDRDFRETVYEGTVKDYNFHSWVEVWFDGIGWVQYEATPGEYYYDMYPLPDTGDITPSDPIITPDIPEIPVLPDVPDTDGPDNTDQPEPWISEELLRVLKISGIILLCLLIVGAVFLYLARGAAKRERERDERIRSIRERRSETKDERRKNALWVIDGMTELLALYGLAPMRGELQSEYAARLLETMPSAFGHVDAPEGDVSAPLQVSSQQIDAEALMMSVAAEEFGNGMTDAELRVLADFYDRLRAQKKRFISPIRRFLLHYFARKI